jgi:hypothetical protein
LKGDDDEGVKEESMASKCCRKAEATKPQRRLLARVINASQIKTTTTTSELSCFISISLAEKKQRK